jgi:hypothetical protein
MTIPDQGAVVAAASPEDTARPERMIRRGSANAYAEEAGSVMRPVSGSLASARQPTDASCM